MKPTQCHLWNATMLTDADLNGVFETVETYSEESHESRRLVTCKQCGQLYLKDFYEEVDWADGEDSMRLTFVPVENKEQADEMNRLGSVAGLSPSLHQDSIKGEAKKVYWVGRD